MDERGVRRHSLWLRGAGRPFPAGFYAGAMGDDEVRNGRRRRPHSRTATGHALCAMLPAVIGIPTTS